LVSEPGTNHVRLHNSLHILLKEHQTLLVGLDSPFPTYTLSIEEEFVVAAWVEPQDLGLCLEGGLLLTHMARMVVVMGGPHRIHKIFDILEASSDVYDDIHWDILHNPVIGTFFITLSSGCV
jgi:hypothetical protein